VLLKLAQDLLPLLRQEQGFEPIPLSVERAAAAKRLLEDEQTVATAVLRSVIMLLGQQCMAWEPESVWLELEDKDVDLPELNRSKFLAASSLLQEPAFYWDANLFENTALAFNSEPVLPEMLQEASPGQLSWAVYEAEMLMYSIGTDPDFDYEPAKYAAVVLHRDGFLLAPELLEFAQEELDKLTRGHKDLRSEVENRWKRTDRDNLDTLELEEKPVDVQVGLLASVQLYVRERAEQYKRDLAALF